jgi:hypothetical protein
VAGAGRGEGGVVVTALGRWRGWVKAGGFRRADGVGGVCGVGVLGRSGGGELGYGWVRQVGPHRRGSSGSLSGEAWAVHVGVDEGVGI